MRGRPIVAVRRGSANAPVRVLVTGSIHGNETAGHAVIARLRAAAPPAGVQVWTVRSVNPDGVARGTRQNARGVDLNRNFPRRWRGGGRAFDTYWPGRRAASEPETRALMALARRIRPVALDPLPPAPAPREPLDRRRPRRRARLRPPRRAAGAAAARLPRHRDELAEPRCAGYERVRGRAAGRRAERGGRAPPRDRGARDRARAAEDGRPAAAAAEKPPIRWSPIPFGADRRRQMRAYSRRHYGACDRPPDRPEGDRGALHRGTTYLRPRSTRSPPTRPTSSCTSAPACARTSSSTATARSTSSSH